MHTACLTLCDSQYSIIVVRIPCNPKLQVLADMSLDDGARREDTRVPAAVTASTGGMRWLYVFAIGLGFFTTGVSWSVFNSYLPADFLPDLLNAAGYIDWQKTIIGAIMVLDNIFALFMQPAISAWSDKTRTRFGRRMPFIMIGTPIAALFFTLIAYGWASFGFWFAFAALTIFNAAMAFYRGPVVSLMPDLVASQHRSRANGVINLMGGLGAIYAFAVASRIYKINDPAIGAMLGVTAEQSGPVLAFLTTSVIMVVSIIVLFFIIKEPAVPREEPGRPREVGILEAFRIVWTSNDRSAIRLMGAIFFWFFSYNIIDTWWTTYGESVIGLLTADASFLLNGIAVSFLIFAIPAGLLAERIGRKKTILIGLVVMLCSLFILWQYVSLVTVTMWSASYFVALGILAFAGLGWALVNVNSIVMMWQIIGQSRLGAATGLYYGASASAAILGPFVAGLFFDLTTIAFMLPFSMIFLLAAFLTMNTVKTGEVTDMAISTE